MDIARRDITGLVLAGGRGSRMGGVDKGLQLLAGRPLAAHALARLAPQVGPLLLNANRHLDAYAALGCAVVADAVEGQPGPLAGMLAGLQRCATPYLATVPCDTPAFPLDLVTRLATALVTAGSSVAMAATAATGAQGQPQPQPQPQSQSQPQPQPQPVFCLLRCSPALQASIAAALRSGRRSVERWALAEGCATALFDAGSGAPAESPFFNVNTLGELNLLH